MLISIEQNPSNRYFFSAAALEGHSEIVQLLAGCTPLFFAAQKGHLEIVKFLAEKNIDLNRASDDENGATPVWIASEKGHLEVVRCFAKQNADLNRADNNGETPIQVALRNGHKEIVVLIFEETIRQMEEIQETQQIIIEALQKK